MTTNEIYIEQSLKNANAAIAAAQSVATAQKKTEQPIQQAQKVEPVQKK